MSTPEPPAPYDPFAGFYNRYWTEPFHRLAFSVVKRVLLARLEPGAHILDVGCGSGFLARLLARQGFRVTGIDLSGEMVRHAREELPEAEFHVADARSFTFPGPFDAAVSTFDTLNHLLTPDDLASALSCVAAALAPGGLFLFDVLEEEAYESHWQDSYAMVEDDRVLAITGAGFDPNDRLARCGITMFEREGECWRRRDTQVVERCYSHREIGAALRRADFRHTTCHDARDLGMAGELGVGRKFYLVTKKEGAAPGRRDARRPGTSRPR